MAEPLTQQGPLGDQRAEDAVRKRARSRNARLHEALRWIVSDNRGQLYLGELVTQSQALLAITGAPTDEAAHYWIGRRSMGVKILEDVEALDRSTHKPLAALLALALATPPEVNHGRQPGNGADADDPDDA